MEPHTTIEETATPIQAVTQEPEKKSSQMRAAIAFVAGLLVAVAGFNVYEQMTIPVAAVVNGAKITQAELDETVDMMMKGAEMQGADITDVSVASEIRTQALTNLINNELLMGAAKTAGVNANEAAVQTAYDNLVTEVGGEEALKTRMETVGLTSDTLMGNIADRLMVDTYIESETDIETLAVTDEEIKTYLDSIATGGVTLPPLEEIRPQIEASLLAEKQQGIIDALIEKLRTEGSIDIKVETETGAEK